MTAAFKAVSLTTDENNCARRISVIEHGAGVNHGDVATMFSTTKIFFTNV